MPFQNDKVGDVIAVLAIMRSKYRNESGDRMITKLRKDAVNSVAETELKSNRFINFISARESINDAFARRLQPDITDRKTFDELSGQWLRINSMRLKDILLKHSTNHSQRAEVNKFFADEKLPDDVYRNRKANAETVIKHEYDNILSKIVETERQTIINQRIGQQIIRKQLLSEYENKCAMCNIDHPDLLRASHIIPWSENIDTRLDIQNILLLCGLHDLAFEKGFIIINDDHTIKINTEEEGVKIILDSITLKKLLLPKSKIYIPKQEYLKIHRDKFKRSL
jgi:predicted restriction endonuclease